MPASKRSQRLFDVLLIGVLLFGTRYFDVLLRRLLHADFAVCGPVILGLNIDTKAIAFVVVAIIAWAGAEILFACLKLTGAMCVLAATGAFYFGLAIAIAVGIRSHSWLQQGVEQIPGLLIGVGLFLSLFYLRFRIPVKVMIFALLLCFVWWFWLGLAATHEFNGLYE